MKLIRVDFKLKLFRLIDAHIHTLVGLTLNFQPKIPEEQNAYAILSPLLFAYSSKAHTHVSIMRWVGALVDWLEGQQSKLITGFTFRELKIGPNM